jgi:hypothetical protein
MEPTEAINGIEASLRLLIRTVLGNTWAARGVLDISMLEARREEERKRRDGAAVESDLLAYTHIYELRKIIVKNWEDFKPALVERKRFDIYMDRIEDFRNVPMHSRDLLPFERDLLSGIAGELRNIVTIYRSSKGPDMNHYPVADSLVDSFGNEIDSDNGVCFTGLRLQIGQVVEFHCRGWDAQSRDLTWTLSSRTLQGAVDSATGDTVTLRWVVGEESVGEDSAVVIEMKSSGTYHRHGGRDGWDFTCRFRYHVDPPAQG